MLVIYDAVSGNPGNKNQNFSFFWVSETWKSLCKISYKTFKIVGSVEK